MASLVGTNYDSSSDDEAKKPTPTTTSSFTAATKIDAAPDVIVEVWSPAQIQQKVDEG